MTVSSEPALDTGLRLSDGRRLQFAEWGDLDGAPLIALHGTPGSRLFCPDVEATAAAHVRLITVDRPGYGGSDEDPDLTIQSVARDLAELCDALRLGPVPVFGWSGGGPYALGLAAASPGLVTSVGVAASSGPLRDVPGLWEAVAPDVREIVDLAARDRSAALPAVRDRCRWYEVDPERILDAPPIPGNPDEALHADPVVNGAMRRWFREGAAQGSTGYVFDWIATYASPWGFELREVGRPVRLWWGDADVICSSEHTAYLAAALREVSLTVYPGEGHLAPVNHWSEILAALQRDGR